MKASNKRDTNETRDLKLGLRLCFIADSSDWVHTRKWVDYFVSHGCQVLVVSPRPGEIPGARVVVFASRRRGVMRLVEALIYMIKLRILLRQYRPDIVHVHFLYNHAFPLNLALWKVRHLIVSAWGRDIVSYTPKERLTQIFAKRFILKQAQFICATSHYLARETAKYAPPGKKIYVTPFGVDERMFAPLAGTKGPAKTFATLGFTKMLLPKYDPDVLIKAMALLVAKHPGTRLVMAGSGSMEEELKRMVAYLDLEENVSFVGVLPHEEIPRLLQEIDIFVMPSYHEEFGVAAVEAEAMGIPVVATKVGGVPEVVVDGKTGILIEPRNPVQLAEAIVKLIEDPNLRLRMGLEGRRFVLKNYRWSENAAEMANLYRKCISLES